MRAVKTTSVGVRLRQPGVGADRNAASPVPAAPARVVGESGG